MSRLNLTYNIATTKLVNPISLRHKEFVAWIKGRIMYTPFTRLQSEEVKFLGKILTLQPGDRLTMSQIYKEPWFTQEFTLPEVRS